MSHSKFSKIAYHGLTFDDVLVLPQYSEVLPRDTSTKTRLTKNLTINIPIISAAMDTVTEAELAIAIAREGGIGIVHKNMSIAQQAAEIKKVKRSESGMIKDPITLKKTNTLGDALNVMKENRIGGIPIINDVNKLVGIITNRDLRFQVDLSTKIEEVMTTNDLITAVKGTDLKEAEYTLQKYKIEKLPVVDSENKLLGLITFKDIQKVKNHPKLRKYSVYMNQNYNRYVFTGKNRIDRADMDDGEEEIMRAFDILCFKGNYHMKRGHGLSAFPPVLLYRIMPVIDLVQFVYKMFEKRNLLSKKQEI